jgi:hypothetical protein
MSLTPKVMVVIRDLSLTRKVKNSTENIFYSARTLSYWFKTPRKTNCVKRVEL